MGKTYSVTGWRIGYVVAPDSCAGSIAALHDFTTVSAAHPCQLALAEALRLPDSFYTRMLQKYAQRKRQLIDALLGLGVVPWDPAGSYFLWCDYSRLTNQSDIDFAGRLLHLAGVAGVPGRVFYPKTSQKHPQRIRFTFSKSPTTISNAAHRLISSKHLLHPN
jgi:N-succinyldiaminopimelate aminotransferase